MKISYGCTPNMTNLISGHNNKVSKDNSTPPPPKNCNCQKNKNCPLDGECLTKNIIYQATVKNKNSNTEENYLGLTGDTFKIRFGNHKKSFNHENYSTDSTLSSHIWKLK